MAAIPIVFRSARELSKMLRARKVSAVELLDLCLDQYMKHNDKLNAVVVTDIDRARKFAAESDKRLAKGRPSGPFDGVPMTIKESFDWRGTPSTWGEPKFRDNIAAEDAVAVSRMAKAGANVYGKTNVPLMLADWQSFNEIYGTTNNPWDMTRSPGGSSGGSAVALATGMSALELGSDIGASIRNPAHYCGVYGHKPTWGVVPISRAHPAGDRAAFGHFRGGATGALGGRSGGDDGTPCRKRWRGGARHGHCAAAGETENAEGLPRGGDAERPGERGGPAGAGHDRQACANSSARG